jgi:hypothetical protein
VKIDSDFVPEGVMDLALKNLQRIELGFGQMPFTYAVKSDENEIEKAPKVIQENIGTWLGYDSLV